MQFLSSFAALLSKLSIHKEKNKYLAGIEISNHKGTAEDSTEMPCPVCAAHTLVLNNVHIFTSSKECNKVQFVVVVGGCLGGWMGGSVPGVVDLYLDRGVSGGAGAGPRPARGAG